MGLDEGERGEALQITNCGRGIHKREVKGVDRFRTALPTRWYGFTNLDLALGISRAREVDIVVVTDRRIFVIDFKHWNGRIESVDGRWELDGEDMDASPVAKINGIARDISILLQQMLQKRPETMKLAAPKVEGLVVLSGRADRSGIAPTESAKVLLLDEFIASVANDKVERNTYGPVFEQFLAEPLTEAAWKDRLSRFFNAGPNSPFKPGRRNFQRYVAEEEASFSHPKDIYREYDAQEDGTPPSLGTLRLWDFTKVPDTRFQTEEGRIEIAGRERQVYHWLRDRNERLEQTLLTPRIDDPQLSVNYWEIYDRRRRLKRLADFALTETALLVPAERIELARQLLAGVAEMHRQGAAHLDLGAHSIWLEAPTTVRFSHLFASRFNDVKSLGASRYQFLASVELPEDLLGGDRGPFRRDVFLAGVAVHQVLFGRMPEGDPIEWNAVVDTGGVFQPLHDWFSEALDLDPGKRFPDARVALEAYNKATAEHPTTEEVLVGLDSFRGTIRSQLSLLSTYPVDGMPIKESDSIDAWKSTLAGSPVVVKIWKRGAWGDFKREGARILSFLERAKQIASDAPDGVPVVRAVFWLGDAIALVQDWAEGKTLSTIVSNPPEEWRSPAKSLTVVGTLLRSLDRLHSTGLGHGDIKPDNIVISEGGKVSLIDVLDFSPRVDGDKQNGAYAPPVGGRLERDRFAVTKIAEELFALVEFLPDHAAKLSKAIETCRTEEPCLATLLPLEEAIGDVQRALERPESEGADRIDISLGVRGASVGELESDEGYYHLRLYGASARGPATLHIRGAAEEIEVQLDDRGNPRTARRRDLGQTRIAMVARHEFHRVEGVVAVTRTDHNDLDDLEAVLTDPVVRRRIDTAFGGAPGEPLPIIEEVSEPEVDEDSDQESLVEEVAAAPPSSDADLQIDVPLLWRTIVKTEKDLTTEGLAGADSGYDRDARRYRVPFDLQSGSFEFDRNDTVGVLRQDRRGGWRRIGELDTRRSRSNAVMIDATGYGTGARGPLVEAGQRLRFVSHFETESLRRRTDAVERILSGSKREAGLLSVFDPRTDAHPERIAHSVNDSDLAAYEFNPDQLEAFRRLIAARPVGILQGPPGTGKTRFIAALAHYAITRKLAQNVLLSSQSHEAVNTAGEALLKLFRQTGGDPSILRVAMSDDQVSDPIRPFHTRPVEQAYKDHFSAEFKERISVVGRALGISDELTGEIVEIERVIRPIVAQIARLEESDSREVQRLAGLRESLMEHLARMQIDLPLDEEIGDADAFVQRLTTFVSGRDRAAPSPDKIARLRASIRLGQDFIGSASRVLRSFETFLAGTRQIVLGTCVGLGRTSLGLTNTAFDLVIIDEAARCTSSELLVPLQAARWAVLVGDQAQLEPHHEAVVVNRVTEATGIPKKEILRSDFERVFLTKYGEEAGARLKTQYRMLPPIGKLVSEVFYPKHALEPGRLEPEIPESALPPELSHPLTWVATDNLNEAAFDKRKSDGGSRTNRVEVDAIVAMLNRWHSHEGFRTWMMEQSIAPISVGVICTYAAQRDLIHQQLLRSPLGHLLGKQLKVGTVDSYQGKENPIVILSLVRNNRDGGWQGGAKTIREGFLASPNRINVAVSRAKDRLLIVGAQERWRTDGPMGRMVESFRRREQNGEARVIAVEEALGAERKRKEATLKRAEKTEKSGEGDDV